VRGTTGVAERDVGVIDGDAGSVGQRSRDERGDPEGDWQ
jgi:hypothetical protein